MTNYNELLQKISSVNAQVQTLNKERQVNLGRKQALETQLSNAIANYKASYGADLTPETVEIEYNKVLAEKQAEVVKLETTLSAIKQGNFAEAETTMGITPTEPAPQTQPAPQPEMPHMTPPPMVAPQTAPQVEIPQSPPSVTVPISQAAAPAPQAVAPAPQIAEPTPHAPTAPAMTPISDTPISAPPINFNSILSGTDFQ
jgi:hypothetical protein